MVRIDLLAGLRVIHGDKTLGQLPTQKGAALLAYLAFYKDRGHSREMLATLLWPEAEPQDDRNSLKQEVARLRRLLQPDPSESTPWIAGDRQAAWLERSLVTTDTAEFEEPLRRAGRISDPAARAALLLQAIALYKGELVPGIYEDWAIRERARFAQSYLLALRQAARDLSQTGQPDQAVSMARKAVDADPLCEESSVDLMRLCIARGRATDALREYQRLERQMRDQLGSSPGPETEALAASCRTRNTRRSGPAEDGPMPPVHEASTAVHFTPLAAPPGPSPLPSEAASIAAPRADRPSRTDVVARSRRWKAALLVSVVLSGLLLTLRGCHTVAPTRYSIQDLGTLPGGTESRATAINNAGQVVGYSRIDPQHNRAFIWDAVHWMQPLRGFRQDTSVAYGINDEGAVTGSRDAGQSFVWKWPAGASRPTATILPLGGAFSINAAGQVAGYVSDDTGKHACVWEQGSARRVDSAVPPGLQLKSTIACFISSSGAVVGTIDTVSGLRGFHWDRKRGFRVLQPGPGDEETSAAMVNSQGEVVGSVTDIQSRRLPCLYDAAGKPRPLKLCGGQGGVAARINNRCQIVGTYDLGGGATRAFLWTREHGMIDLTALVPPNLGWTLTDANGINDAGQIVGAGIHGEHIHAFLLTPARATTD